MSSAAPADHGFMKWRPGSCNEVDTDIIVIPKILKGKRDRKIKVGRHSMLLLNCLNHRILQKYRIQEMAFCMFHIQHNITR